MLCDSLAMFLLWEQRKMCLFVLFFLSYNSLIMGKGDKYPVFLQGEKEKH